MRNLPPAVSCRYILFVGKQLEPGGNGQQRVSLKLAENWLRISEGFIKKERGSKTTQHKTRTIALGLMQPEIS